VIDEWARRIGRYLLHQSDRKLPRTYFLNGISSGTKLAGHERIGVLLVLHIMLKMKAPCDAIINNKYNNMTEARLNRWRKAFGLQLAWRAWLKQDVIPMDEVTVSTLGHKRLMSYLLRHARRTEKMEWRIIKFHMIIHMTRYMMDYGVPANIGTSTMEHNHIENAKNPSKGTQQRAYTLERQTATRYYENLVLECAMESLGITAARRAAKAKATVDDPNALRGSRFRFDIQEGVNGDLGDYTFSWLTRQTKGCYPKRHIDWVARHIHYHPSRPSRFCPACRVLSRPPRPHLATL
jgi:hypothetical protein